MIDDSLLARASSAIPDDAEVRQAVKFFVDKLSLDEIAELILEVAKYGLWWEVFVCAYNHLDDNASAEECMSVLAYQSFEWDI